MPWARQAQPKRRLTGVRDTLNTVETPAPTVSAVWLWDCPRAAVVWASPALLGVFGAADLAALRADSAYSALVATSERLQPGQGATAFVVQRGSRVLHGSATASRFVLADGMPGLRVTWLLTLPPPAVDPAVAARAFEEAPLAMAVLAPDGVPVVMNAAFAARRGLSAQAPVVSDGSMRPEPGVRITALGDGSGLRLMSVEPPAAASAAVVEAAALSRIAHEFRSPLTAVLGFAEFLSATLDDLPKDRAKGYLADLGLAAERMRRLADDLVALGQGPAGLRVAEASLDAIMAEAVRLARPSAEAKGVALGGPAPSGLVALADADALGRAVANLLDNAIRHGAARGGAVHLRLTDAGRSAGATITVEDDGPGLDPAALAEALAPYGRPGPRGDAAPGGLGLPIVKDIAEAHGGHLAIDTAPGRGFRATIQLPAGRVFRTRPAR